MRRCSIKAQPALGACLLKPCGIRVEMKEGENEWRKYVKVKQEGHSDLTRSLTALYLMPISSLSARDWLSRSSRRLSSACSILFSSTTALLFGAAMTFRNNKAWEGHYNAMMYVQENQFVHCPGRLFLFQEIVVFHGNQWNGLMNRHEGPIKKKPDVIPLRDLPLVELVLVQYESIQETIESVISVFYYSSKEKKNHSLNLPVLIN